MHTCAHAEKKTDMQKQNRVHPYSLPLTKSPLSHTSLVMPHLHSWCTALHIQLTFRGMLSTDYTTYAIQELELNHHHLPAEQVLTSDVQRCIPYKAQGEILGRAYGLPSHWGYFYYVATGHSTTDRKDHGGCEKATGNCMTTTWNCNCPQELQTAGNGLMPPITQLLKSLLLIKPIPARVYKQHEDIPPLTTGCFMHK